MVEGLRILVTGGTFDKDYDMINGRLFFDRTHLPEMLEHGRCTLPIVFEQVMLKDSLDLTDDDRATIVDRCRLAEERRLVITHGTDTMVQTAHTLAAATLEKTVVLTGAMIPYRFGTSSDGFFNLGAALSFAQLLAPGVYVAMNGRYFPYDDVRKNRETGFFEALSEGPAAAR